MRFGHLAAACTAGAVLAGCGTADSLDSSGPAPSTPTVTTSSPSPTRALPEREAVNPKPQFVSYRRADAATSGGALVTGTLAVRDGCLVLEPGGQVVAFDADHASFDGTTVALTPVAPGDPTVRVGLGQQVRFGGGYGDYTDARTNPRVAVPRACANLDPSEVAYVEDWRPFS